MGNSGFVVAQLHTLCKCMKAFVKVTCVFIFDMRFMIRPTPRNAVMQFVLFLLKCQCIHSNRQVIVTFLNV